MSTKNYVLSGLGFYCKFSYFSTILFKTVIILVMLDDNIGYLTRGSYKPVL